MNKVLYLILRDSNPPYLVGKLTNYDNVKYVFEYLSDDAGIPVRFTSIQYLALTYQVHEWYGLPEGFDEMIINPNRPDVPRILTMLGMSSYDPWEYLRRTKGFSPTNQWEFRESIDGLTPIKIIT